MLDSDKTEFASILTATLKVYRSEADKDVMRLWWGVLNRYEMDAVRAGFSALVSDPKIKFPVPADVIAQIDKLQPDGRPSADEAWAMIPRDEYTSAVITEEMGEAYGIALPLLNEGDAIAARRSFIDAYNRIVEANKLACIKPKWFPSLGRDAAQRETVLREAERIGRLSHSHVSGLLPAPEAAHEMLEILSLPKPLTDEERATGLSRIKAIREQLGRKAA